MIAVIEREFVEKKRWLTSEEFLDVVAVAESSPGPIAINSATFIGYKVGGVLGSVFATLGVVLPSFTVIFIISLFFERFLALEYVGYAFRGIQACVAFLILAAGIKMLTSLKRNALNVTLVLLSVAAMIGLEFIAPDFSTVFLILIGGVIGLTVYLAGYFRLKAKGRDKDASSSGKGGE